MYEYLIQIPIFSHKKKRILGFGQIIKKITLHTRLFNTHTILDKMSSILIKRMSIISSEYIVILGFFFVIHFNTIWLYNQVYVTLVTHSILLGGVLFHLLIYLSSILVYNANLSSGVVTIDFSHFIPVYISGSTKKYNSRK